MYLVLFFTILVILMGWYPFSFSIVVDEGRISVYFMMRRLYHQKWQDTTKQVGQYTIAYIEQDILHWEDIIYLRLLSIIHYRYVTVDLSVSPDDYALAAQWYGITQGILYSLDQYLTTQNVPFTYKIRFNKPLFFQLQAKMNIQIVPLLQAFLLLRRQRHARTSHS